LRRDEIAVDMGAGRGHVDIDAANGRYLGLAIFECSDLLAPEDALDRHQYLRAVANRKDRLSGFVVPDNALNLGIDADVLRTASARDIDGIVSFGVDFREGRVQGLQMSGSSRYRLTRLQNREARS